MFRFRLFLVVLYILIFSAISFAAVLLDRVVAVVNKEVITWSELYRTMETDASPQTKGLSEEDRRRIFKENEAAFLETLIDVKLQLQKAKSMGIRVTDGEIDEAIENIKKKYSMTDFDFKESLKKEGYTLEVYRRRIEEQIITSKIINQQIRSKILVSDKDTERYMEENREMFATSDSYRISQIFFKKPENNEEKNNIDRKVAVIYKKLKDGESFRKIAREYSDGPSAKTGGDLGFIKKGDLIEEFGEIVSKMTPGDVSSLFWTDRGFHIIRLDERIEYKDQNEIKNEVRKILEKKFFIEKYNAWKKELKEKAVIEIRL